MVSEGEAETGEAAAMSDHPYLGVRLWKGDRAVIMGESYTGHGRDDPDGHYFVFEDEPELKHWVSATRFAANFTTEKPNMDSKTTAQLRARLEELKAADYFDSRDAYEISRERYRLETEIMRRDLMNQ